jgi:uncharacterized protein YegP (UPF0339 family)
VKTATFHVYRDRKGEYRWRLRSINGCTVADSGEGYKTKRGAVRAIAGTLRAAFNAKVVS